MKTPSKERGCEGKMKIKGDYLTVISKAFQTSMKHQKRYGAYVCPHCGYSHLTTNLEDKYDIPLIYITPPIK